MKLGIVQYEVMKIIKKFERKLIKFTEKKDVE